MDKRAIGLVLGMLALGLAVQAKTWSYYGHLLHGWDAQFYYAQSRSLVVERSLDITESLESVPDPSPFGRRSDGHFEAVPRRDGRIVNKYPIGLSLLESPFLAAGTVLSDVFRRPEDGQNVSGYRDIQIATVAAGLLLCVALGCGVLYQLLERAYGSMSAVIGIVAAWLGTSLFYYSAVFPFMAHGMAFALVCLILWQISGMRARPEAGWRDLCLLSATFGLLFLVRPQQILLLPIALPAMVAPIARSKFWPARLLVFSVVLGAVCGVQAAVNLFHFGSPTVNAYAAGGEGFRWLRPDWYTVLVSSHRGLLWISPIAAVAAAGILWYRPRSWLEYVVLAHGIVQAYLIAAWSSPDQGDAFGARMWCECAPLVAVGVAKVMAKAETAKRLSWGGVTAVAVAWTSVCMVMYVRGHLSDALGHGEILSRAVHGNIW
jgi:hypothetical protein